MFSRGLPIITAVLGAAILFGSARLASAQEGAERVFKNCSPGTPPCAKNLLSGTYRGSITDVSNGTGTLTIVIVEKGKLLKGTWAATYSNGESRGVVKGKLSKSGVLMKVQTPIAHCFYEVIASVVGTIIGQRVSFDMNGTFVTSPRCPQENSGNFAISTAFAD
jgi:hypothetical protein